MKTELAFLDRVAEDRKPRPLGNSEAIHRKRFDDLTELACVACGVPMALISLTEKDAQHIRSQTGLPAPLLRDELVFCRHVAAGDELLVVEDVTGDTRFAGQRLAPAAWGAWFLAGVPLRVADGEIVGTLCVLDRQPRRLAPQEQSALRALGRQVVTQIELSRALGRVGRASAQQRHAECVLAEERNLLRTLIDSIPDCVYLKDEQGRYILDNRAHQQALGTASAAAVIGKTVFDFFPATTAARFTADDQAVLRLGQPLINLEEPSVDRNGLARVLLTTKVPLRDSHGQPLGLVCVSRDVTRAKEAAQALHESEERFRLLVDGVKDYAVYMLHPRGHVMSWNSGAERIFGYSAQEILGEQVACFFKPSEAEAGAVADELGVAVASGRCEREGWRVRKDGTWFFANVTTTALRAEGGGLRGFAQVVRDITEWKHTTEDLEDRNRMLEQALTELHRTQQELVQHERLRALGQMASGIAHDFNNALAPILGFSDLLLNRPGSLADQALVARYLDLIRLKARDATRIVGRLREFYRYRDDHDAFQPVQLNDLVRQALRFTQPKWEDAARAAGLTIEVHTDLQPLPLITGLAPELQEAVSNLILNSVEALMAGHRSGRVELRSRLDAEHVVLEIADSGPGMDDQTRQHCFEPFVSTKTAHGAGLGLAMVYGIITRHGGLISIASEPGRDTTVVVRLPVQTSRQINGFHLEAGHAVPPLRILLVDDEPELREVAAEFLKEDGHRIELAADGRQALAKFRAGEFDLVLTDKAMPELDGEQLAVAIKQLRPETPVVLVTGFGDMMKAAGEKPAAIDLILSKPLSMHELRHAVAQYAPLKPPAGR